MRAGGLRAWAGLAVLALLTAHPVRAQGVLPPPAGVTAPPAPPMPLLDGGVPPLPEAHAEEAHAEEAERGLLSGLILGGEYLLLHPRRNALDYAVVSPDPNLTPGGDITPPAASASAPATSCPTPGSSASSTPTCTASTTAR
jgi:hypothetical protein